MIIESRIVRLSAAARRQAARRADRPPHGFPPSSERPFRSDHCLSVAPGRWWRPALLSDLLPREA